VSNPKVFEYAKEIGMTPLALMDKIREWQLPIKSHMAEIKPEILEQIEEKLQGSEKSAGAAKSKKTATKKAPAKKTAAKTKTATAKSATATKKTAPAAKSTVVRRKAAVVETVEEAPEEQVEEAVDAAEEVSAAVEVESEPAAASTATVQPPATAKPISPTAQMKTEPQEVVEAKVSTAAPITEPAAAQTAVVANPVTAAPVAPQAPATAPIVSRKKEVAIGSSGVASSQTPVNAPRRNIVGRMDLARVQAPQGSGGYQGRQQQGGPGGGPGANRTGGFSAPPRSTANRGLRAGFVAQSNPVSEPITPGGFDIDFERRREQAKRSKKVESAAPVASGPTAKERELEELKEFNAVEFRKREMVFQPKKKKDILGRQAKKTQLTTPKASKRVLEVYGSMKLSAAAQEMGLKAPQLIKVLVQNGVMANMNSDLDADTLALIAPEFGWEAKNVQKSEKEIITEVAFGDLEAERITRPPVVTIMGHVDHGKTSLLDAIRSAKVAAGEAGGITQHIGAYSVNLADGYPITFLDTPGHEAFTAMRARGANATDIAIIVVAADDGMMPQTQEAVSHAKAAGVPIIVAVNKMDKPGANPEKIKQQLTEMQLVPEEWGGTTIYAPVSALKKTGIDELLEHIKLVAEMQELKANPKRSGTGLVIEAKMEKGRGPVATLLVKDGTIKVGQYLVAGTTKGRVKSLTNDRGEKVESVLPGYPVEVLGLDDVPAAGDRWDIVKDERDAEEVAANRREQFLTSQNQQSQKKTLEEIFSKAKQGDLKELPLIVKADVHGSVEAILGMLAKLNTPEVKTKVLLSAVGGISESDVLLAQTSKGMILGFNVRPDTVSMNKAKQIGVEIRTYSVVYEMVDDMKRVMSGMLTPDIVEKIMGRAEVRNTFTVPKAGMIAGCFVVDGKIQRSNQVRLIRDGKIIIESKISSLKRFKDDAKEVAQGFECGVGFENFNDIKVGDVIEAFIKEEKIRELHPEAKN
jgi:translation initiation factor IF-2